MITLAILAVGGSAINGLFSKAFDKTLSPGEIYERNITIRKYYDLVIRFQKENSTSYLAFDNNETEIVLKDANGNEITRITGVNNGRVYINTEKSLLDTIKTVSVSNLDSYLDVDNQQVNVTYSGATAYITVRLNFKSAVITGYVLDETTGNPVEGVEVLAFPNDSDPTTTDPILQNTSASNGRYFLTLQLNSSKALDVYVKDYDVV